jgi:antitoxin component YwqK of YwqJK toxin-antitoxin module
MKKLIFILMILISSVTFGSSIEPKYDTSSNVKTEFYESGKVKNQFVKIGTEYKVTRYYESGPVEEIGFYNSLGEKNGEWKRYYEDGKMFATANYRDGIKHGDWKIYNPQGNMITYLKYKKGKRVEAFMWTETSGIVCQ